MEKIEDTLCKDMFTVEFPEKFNFKEYYVLSIDKPKFVNNEWDIINIQFCNSEHSLFKIIEHIKQSTLDSHEPLFSFKIKNVNAASEPNGEWLISVEKVLNINFGDLAYCSLDYQIQKMQIKPLDCVLIS